MRNLVLLLVALCFGLTIKAQEKLYFIGKQDGSNFYSINSINIDGSQQTALFNDNFNRWSISVSKDASEMIYYKTTSDFPMFAPFTAGSGQPGWICKSKMDGSNEQIIWTNTDYLNNIVFSLDWSNDKQKIIIEYGSQNPDRNSDIYEINLITNSFTNLTNSFDYFKGLGDETVKYSPDNLSIIYIYCPTGWFSIPTNIYKMNSDGSNQIQLTNFSSENSRYINFSNDGNKILYTKDFVIHTMNNDGTNDYEVTLSSGVNSAYYPVFNSDESKLAFGRDNKIVISQSDGTILNEISLTNITTFNQILWLNSKSLNTQTQTATVGRTIEIPVNTSELTVSDNIISYQFDFNYDNTKLEYIGNSIVGTLAEGGTLQLNPTTNKLSIAWADDNAIIGAGEILKLQFKVLDAGTITPTITNALFNATAVTSITNGIRW